MIHHFGQTEERAAGPLLRTWINKAVALISPQGNLSPENINLKYYKNMIFYIFSVLFIVFGPIPSA